MPTPNDVREAPARVVLSADGFAALAADAARWREAFGRYGAHLPECPAFEDADRECACGFRALLIECYEPAEGPAGAGDGE